jgi:hypothetical protein
MVPSLYVTLGWGWGWEEDEILGLLLLEGCWFLKMDCGDAKSVVGFRRAEGAIFALLDHIELLLLFSSSAAVDEDEDGGGKSP